MSFAWPASTGAATTGATAGAWGGWGASTTATGTTTAGSSGGNGKSAAFVQMNTKYKDLPQPYEKRFAELDKHIRRQAQLRDAISEHLKTASQKEDKLSVQAISSDVAAIQSSVEREIFGIEAFAAEVRTELKHSEVADRTWTKLSNPTSTTLQESIYLPTRYDWEKLGQYQSRMAVLKKQIDEIDEYLAGAEQQALLANPKALPGILHGQHEALMALTAKAVALHAAADELREEYAAIKGIDAKEAFKEKKESTFDPFLVVDANAIQATSLSSMIAPTTSSVASSSSSSGSIGWGASTGAGWATGSGASSGSGSMYSFTTGSGASTSAGSSFSFGGSGSASAGTTSSAWTGSWGTPAKK